MKRLPIVLSVAALFVAILGWTGVGEAAKNAVLPKKSVGTAQLKPNSVGSKQIKRGAVRLTDIHQSVKRNLRGTRGPAGPQGLAGAAGTPGPQGLAGPSWPLTTTPLVTVSVAPGIGETVDATCPPGQNAVGGGFIFADVTIAAGALGNIYRGGFFNTFSTPTDATVWAVCAPVEVVFVSPAAATNRAIDDMDSMLADMEAKLKASATRGG